MLLLQTDYDGYILSDSLPAVYSKPQAMSSSTYRHRKQPSSAQINNECSCGTHRMILFTVLVIRSFVQLGTGDLQR